MPRRLPVSPMALTAMLAWTVLAASATHAGAAASTPPWLTERKIIGNNGLHPIAAADDPAAYEFARAVARVERRTDGYGFCTATRVGDGLFLSNYHCDQDCTTLQFTLGYEADVPEAERQVFQCLGLVHKELHLDYALFRAAPVGAPPLVPYPSLSLYGGPLAAGMPVIVPQHPRGRFKEIDDSDDCVVSDTAVIRTASGRDTVKHLCDSEGGSSGAPLIAKPQGYVVGIHWGGLDDQYNYAVPMALIIADLAQVLGPKDWAQLHVVDAPVPPKVRP